MEELFHVVIHPDFNVTAEQMTAQNKDCFCCLPSQVSTANGTRTKLTDTDDFPVALL